MKLFLATDHAAFEQKEEVKEFLKELGHEVVDLGTNSSERSNYPEFAIKLAKSVVHANELGILLCGSGIGVSMTANRFKGIRAALCRSSEEAKLSRQHNDANVLCLGGRISSMDEIKEMITVWLKTDFEGGRHSERIALFNDIGEDV